MSSLSERLHVERRFDFNCDARPSNTFAVVRVSGVAAIPKPYRFEPVLVSDDAAIDFTQLLGAGARLHILAPDNALRATPHEDMPGAPDQAFARYDSAKNVSAKNLASTAWNAQVVFRNDWEQWDVIKAQQLQCAPATTFLKGTGARRRRCLAHAHRLVGNGYTHSRFRRRQHQQPHCDATDLKGDGPLIKLG